MDTCTAATVSFSERPRRMLYLSLQIDSHSLPLTATSSTHFLALLPSPTSYPILLAVFTTLSNTEHRMHPTNWSSPSPHGIPSATQSGQSMHRQPQPSLALTGQAQVAQTGAAPASWLPNQQMQHQVVPQAPRPQPPPTATEQQYQQQQQQQQTQVIQELLAKCHRADQAEYGQMIANFLLQCTNLPSDNALHRKLVSTAVLSRQTANGGATLAKRLEADNTFIDTLVEKRKKRLAKINEFMFDVTEINSIVPVLCALRDFNANNLAMAEMNERERRLLVRAEQDVRQRRLRLAAANRELRSSAAGPFDQQAPMLMPEDQSGIAALNGLAALRLGSDDAERPPRRLVDDEAEEASEEEEKEETNEDGEAEW